MSCNSDFILRVLTFSSEFWLYVSEFWLYSQSSDFFLGILSLCLAILTFFLEFRFFPPSEFLVYLLQFWLFPQILSLHLTILFLFCFLVPPWNKKVKVIVTFYITIQTFFPCTCEFISQNLVFSFQNFMFFFITYDSDFFSQKCESHSSEFIYCSSEFISRYFSELQEKNPNCEIKYVSINSIHTSHNSVFFSPRNKKIKVFFYSMV